MTRAADLRTRFRALHHDPPDTPTPGILVMPNPWDVGSARILQAVGALALATTSSGHAATLGRHDQHVTRDELIAHAADLAAAVGVPLSVDAEDGMADDVRGVGETFRRLAATDVAGASIEDYDPRTRSIRSVEGATERVAAARAAADGIVLTARCESHLYGPAQLDDTIARLVSYRDAGADVAYAPGVTATDDIRRIIEAVGIPVNVLVGPGMAAIPELAEAGVARVSTGGGLAWAAYGALARAADELLTSGTTGYADGMLPGTTRSAAFGARS